MKKRGWRLILPVLLGGAVFWAREVSWRRLEADFRRDFIAESTQFASRPLVELARHDLTGKYQKTVGRWQNKELELALAEVHLMRETPRMRFIYGPFYTVTYAIKNSGRYGLTLAVNKDEATFDFVSPQNQNKWQGLELTPESCRALKRRIQHYK